MGKRRWWNSISWKLVFVYFVLVFIATSILGMFIIDRMDDYYMKSIRNNISRTIKQGEIMSSISVFEDLQNNQDKVKKIVDSWDKSFKEEVFIIDKDMVIVATNNVGTDIKSIDEQDLDENLIIEGLLGKDRVSDGRSGSGKPVKNMVFTIKHAGKITGAIYVRSDLSTAYAAIDKVKSFFIKAMILSVIITVLVGLFISRGITAPIKKITGKAMDMANGNFGDEIEIEGNDEIGDLGDSLNFLDKRISTLLGELSGEKTKLEAILKNLSNGVVVLYLDGTLIHVNRVAKKILGIDDDDIENKKYDDIIKYFSQELLLEKIEKNCRLLGVSDMIEYGGSIFDIRYDRYKDEEGKEGIILLIQDITERQKLEKAQMDFVANVSHELKTPLTTIKSYSETLSETYMADFEMSRQFLGIISDEADRMARIVKGLLELSKLDNQLAEWNFKNENTVEILNTSVKKLSIMAESKSLQVNKIYDDDLKLPALVDKDKLEQVFLNLISNAIKYTDEGRRIDIDAYREDKKAIIVISDTGIGIPAESISRIFERFYCVDKARTRSQGGTGLGLPISKQIIEQTGGSIDIESRVGEGTKVTVKLDMITMRGTPNIE